jgi:hypothetical protein
MSSLGCHRVDAEGTEQCDILRGQRVAKNEKKDSFAPGSSRGHENATGFVPYKGDLPPSWATKAFELTQVSPIIPAALSVSTTFLMRQKREQGKGASKEPKINHGTVTFKRR